MEGLTCKFCHSLSDQFSILKCDHVVCAECLWGGLKTSLSGTNTIRCPCGQSTSFTSKSIKSPYATTNISGNASPRRNHKNSQVLRTEWASLSRMKQSNDSMSKMKTSMNLGKDTLSRQLQFLNIQFRKSIEQLQNNFNLIVQNMQTRFQNLVQNIRLFWLEEIVQHDTLHMLNLSKMLERKYHKAIGHKLHNLNETLLDNLVGFRLETESSSKLICSRSRSSNKQNQQSAVNMQESDKLMNVIQKMKEDSRCLRKMAKKSGKYKFL